MKVLLVNECDRYYYPSGITTLEEFVEFANAHYNKLIPLTMLQTQNCVHPYYIEEEKKLFFINASNINNITDDDVQILSKCDYDKRLEKVVQTLCINCSSYEEDQDGDNMKGHRDKLCLDGTCWLYKKKED